MESLTGLTSLYWVYAGTFKKIIMRNLFLLSILMAASSLMPTNTSATAAPCLDKEGAIWCRNKCGTEKKCTNRSYCPDNCPQTCGLCVETNCPDTDSSVEILRGRTLDNVLEITDSSHVIIADITFWASNIIASENNNRIAFDSLIFKFPSSSHRMLKNDSLPKHTTLYGNNNSVINCTFEGSEGPALQYNGDNMLVHNSEFSYNDWAGHGNLGTVMDKSSRGEFSQNTLYYNGPACGLRYTGRNSNITLNHMQGQCWGKIQSDGASIQISTGD